MENKIKKHKLKVFFDDNNYEIYCHLIHFNYENNRFEFRNFNDDIIEKCVYLTDIDLDFSLVSHILASFPMDKTAYFVIKENEE